MEAVLTMWPPSPWARMCGRKVRTPCSTPMRLTSSTHRHVSSEMSSMPPPPATPALLQTTWTFPNASYDASAACSTLEGSVTSQPTPRTPSPRRRKLSTATASAFVSMSASITCIPASAKARPSANPIPLAPPVTNAVLPTRSRMAPLYELSNKDRNVLAGSVRGRGTRNAELRPHSPLWREKFVRSLEPSQLVHADRRQALPVSRDEIVADDQRQIERFRHRLDAADQIDRRTDDREIEAVRGADIAVDDRAVVQRDGDPERRLADWRRS